MAVSPNGDAYVVDGVKPLLYRIPAAALGQHRPGVQRLAVFRSLRNTPIYDDPDAYGPRGIVATSDGRFLIVGNGPPVASSGSGSTTGK